MSRKAIIDIGSNSIKFFVGELAPDRSITTVADTSEVTRLSEGLDRTGGISPQVMERNVNAVAAFQARAVELGADQTAAVGTMALRCAKNSGEFVRRVREACGVEVRVIPGEEEARLSYLAARSGLALQGGELVVFDTGGGSTEFIFGRGAEVVRRFSVNLGAVRITENYLKSDPTAPDEVEAALAQIDREFAQAGVGGRPAQLVGIGGTVTSMSAVKHKMARYDPDVIQGSTLTRADIQAQISGYSAKTIQERRTIPGLHPRRADVILAGACILDVITRRLNADSLTVSYRGLRHGLAYDLFQA